MAPFSKKTLLIAIAIGSVISGAIGLWIASKDGIGTMPIVVSAVFTGCLIVVVLVVINKLKDRQEKKAGG